MAVPDVVTGPDILRAARDPEVVAKQRRARIRKRWARRAAAAVLLAAIAGALVVMVRPSPLPAELAAARRGHMQVTIDEPGRTRVRDRYVVVAPLAGELGRIQLRAGDAVTRGQVLARIVPQAPPLLDPRSRAEATARLAAATAASQRARADVERLDLSVRHARDDAERTRKLADSGSISRDEESHAELEATLRARELASARFAAETAAHEVEVATAALGRYGELSKAREAFEIASPIDGRVLRVLQPSEGLVSPSTPLVELGDPRQLEVVVDVLTEDAVGIPPHARVTLDRWGGGQPLAGHVRLVEPSAFTRLSALGVEEQRVNVVIDFDDPPERRAALGDGYRVETHVVTWERDDALTIPAGAVFRQGDGWAAFVASDGRARLRPVEIGRRGPSDVELTGGLADGERVVVHPGEKMADGVRIESR